ncbi:hypothetical protein NDU88_003232 [Pleurodeles waltl]|uniref:Uncharacterized protein n=1 Tax=Pleurodeles waltl TaxID=8319 RepID=A0AAV7W5L3_PLEWA|nr:hypothetical protein NDU88_003232 [Pleurodeles waltl]
MHSNKRSRVLPWAARTGQAPRSASRVGHSTEERLLARKHGRCTHAALSSATAWELQRSSGEQCAAPGCDWRGAGGEARLIPGGPLGLQGPLQTPQAKRAHHRLARPRWEMRCAALCAAKEALEVQPR